MSKILDAEVKKKPILMLSSAIREAVTTWKRSPFLIKFLFILFFGCHFVRTFIYATTNSLRDLEVSEFLEPFYVYTVFTQLILGLFLLIYFTKKKELSSYFILGSIVLLIGSVVILLYEFSPCMFKHTNSLTDHIHPHPVDYILKESFLCPSYSHRSRFHLMFLVIIGVLILGISLMNKKKH